VGLQLGQAVAGCCSRARRRIAVGDQAGPSRFRPGPYRSCAPSRPRRIAGEQGDHGLEAGRFRTTGVEPARPATIRSPTVRVSCLPSAPAGWFNGRKSAGEIPRRLHAKRAARASPIAQWPTARAGVGGQVQWADLTMTPLEQPTSTARPRLEFNRPTRAIPASARAAPGGAGSRSLLGFAAVGSSRATSSGRRRPGPPCKGIERVEVERPSARSKRGCGDHCAPRSRFCPRRWINSIWPAGRHIALQQIPRAASTWLASSRVARRPRSPRLPRSSARPVQTPGPTFLCRDCMG